MKTKEEKLTFFVFYFLRLSAQKEKPEKWGEVNELTWTVLNAIVTIIKRIKISPVNIIKKALVYQTNLKVLRNWSYGENKFRNLNLKNKKVWKLRADWKVHSRMTFADMQYPGVIGMTSKLLTWFLVPWRYKWFQTHFQPFWLSKSHFYNQNGH